MKNSVSFSAKITKLGINPVVDPPENVLAAIFKQANRSAGPIPVRGKVNGAEFVQTLVRYKGAWRLYVNGEMLKASGTKVGDLIKIEIEFDPRSRDVPIPKKLQIALTADEQARIAFAELPPSRQKEIFRYINSLRTEESIARNVEKILQQLKGKIIEKPLVVLRGARKKK